MPKQLTQDEFRKIYLTLPQDVKDALFSVDVANALQDIAKKYELHIDKVGVLSSAVAEIMLAIAPPHGFGKRLQDGLGVDAAKAVEITKDINERVFKPIRESLMKVHKKAGHLEEKIENRKQKIEETKPEEPQIAKVKVQSEVPPGATKLEARQLPPEVEKMLEKAPEVPAQIPAEIEAGKPSLPQAEKPTTKTQETTVEEPKVPLIFQKPETEEKTEQRSELKGEYNDKDPYREQI